MHANSQKITTQSAFCVSRLSVSIELYGCTTTSLKSSWKNKSNSFSSTKRRYPWTLQPTLKFVEVPVEETPSMSLSTSLETYWKKWKKIDVYSVPINMIPSWQLNSNTLLVTYHWAFPKGTSPYQILCHQLWNGTSQNPTEKKRVVWTHLWRFNVSLLNTLLGKHFFHSTSKLSLPSASLSMISNISSWRRSACKSWITTSAWEISNQVNTSS